MGWWQTNRAGVSFASDDIELIWGDGPADILSIAIDKIDKEFFETQGRYPTKEELIAGMRFSYGVVHAWDGEIRRRAGEQA